MLKKYQIIQYCSKIEENQYENRLCKELFGR